MKKKLMAVLALVLVIAMSVAGTYAYLTSQDKVENTFTVGKVGITMDEAKVDVYGKIDSSADRVKENTYKLVPGHGYTKDPTVYVTAGSEECYVFVKVENGLKDIIVDDTTINAPSIEKQITEEEGWALLGGTANVYYKHVSAEDAAKGTTLYVFGGFQLKDDITNEQLEQYADEKITVTAYAVQYDGFGTAEAAWNATFGE